MFHKVAIEGFHSVASSHVNYLEKKVFTKEEGLTPTGLVWGINMPAGTSCENALYYTLGILSYFDHRQNYL